MTAQAWSHPSTARAVRTGSAARSTATTLTSTGSRFTPGPRRTHPKTQGEPAHAVRCATPIRALSADRRGQRILDHHPLGRAERVVLAPWGQPEECGGDHCPDLWLRSRTVTRRWLAQDALVAAVARSEVKLDDKSVTTGDLGDRRSCRRPAWLTARPRAAARRARCPNHGICRVTASSDGGVHSLQRPDSGLIWWHEP